MQRRSVRCALPPLAVCADPVWGGQREKLHNQGICIRSTHDRHSVKVRGTRQQSKMKPFRQSNNVCVCVCVRECVSMRVIVAALCSSDGESSKRLKQDVCEVSVACLKHGEAGGSCVVRQLSGHTGGPVQQ